jgi:hypothetical protein
MDKELNPLTIEFVPEQIVDGYQRAWIWLLRGEEGKLELLANKANRHNPEPIKYIFECEKCPALLLLKANIARQSQNYKITRSITKWEEILTEDIQSNQGFEYPLKGKGAIYDRGSGLVRVAGFCRAIRQIFDGEIVEVTNCS